MISIAFSAPSRPSLRMPTLRDNQLNVNLYTYRSRRIWQFHQCSVFAGTPHQSLHFSFLILLQSFTLEIRRPHGELRTGISRESYEEKSKEIRFRMYKQRLDRLGDIESGCALVAHHEDDADENRIAELRKGNIVHINAMSRLSTLLRVNVVRPLLAMRKSDLVDFAERARVCYMQDSTPKWSRRGWIQRTLGKIATEDVESHVSFLSQLSRAGSAFYSFGNALDLSLKNLVAKRVRRTTEYTSTPSRQTSDAGLSPTGRDLVGCTEGAFGPGCRSRAPLGVPRTESSVPCCVAAVPELFIELSRTERSKLKAQDQRGSKSFCG